MYTMSFNLIYYAVRCNNSHFQIVSPQYCKHVFMSKAAYFYSALSSENDIKQEVKSCIIKT